MLCELLTLKKDGREGVKDENTFLQQNKSKGIVINGTWNTLC